MCVGEAELHHVMPRQKTTSSVVANCFIYIIIVLIYYAVFQMCSYPHACITSAVHAEVARRANYR